MNITASPFSMGKMRETRDMLSELLKKSIFHIFCQGKRKAEEHSTHTYPRLGLPK